MNIGITYDLRDQYLKLGFSEEETAEFDKKSTIDAIDNTLKELGHTTERIGNIWDLTRKLNKGKTWDLVFNIAEGLRGIGREAQVPAILDAYNIPYTFSDPLVLALTLHKGMTKRVLRDLKIPTPDFFEVHKIEDVKKVKLKYPLFAKPNAEGTGKGITGKSIIKNKKELYEVCEYLLTTFKQPVLVEEFLPGREFTTGIVGTGEKAKVIGSMEVILLKDAEPDVYSYANKDDWIGKIEYKLVNDPIVKKAEKFALEAWKGLGCRDAGRIDIRVDKYGVPNIIELNPLAGIHPTHSDLPIICTLKNIEYKTLFNWIIESASERIVEQKQKLEKVVSEIVS
ncbi:MAG: ATP-grasp domain-containing protein [Ignavibacteriae bacterium]|nr:ATP-grasp domain-containing protein [Ignavibacteriota bacterium]MCB9210076.1 ATP-grasp domain-containing protein [Ignavibacteriales bacterium]MCB9218539.1 ATP-grasp domain-containing protein [Ignavibacteriales bacterium]MCB9259455.1 ATP-grasp domain-containing protein [Ignavibacteriales bacterium]